MLNVSNLFIVQVEGINGIPKITESRFRPTKRAVMSVLTMVFRPVLALIANSGSDPPDA